MAVVAGGSSCAELLPSSTEEIDPSWLLADVFETDLALEPTALDPMSHTNFEEVPSCSRRSPISSDWLDPPSLLIDALEREEQRGGA